MSALSTEKYLVAQHKAELTLKVAKAERRLLAGNEKTDISLYIGFLCPLAVYTVPLRLIPLSSMKKEWTSIWMPCSKKWNIWQNTPRTSV